jgi:hypothetical protein
MQAGIFLVINMLRVNFRQIKYWYSGITSAGKMG